MDVNTACDLINVRMAFWQNWRLMARPSYARKDHIYVEGMIDTVDTSYPDRDGVCRSTKITIGTPVLDLDVTDLDVPGVCHAILKWAGEIGDHENREALKVLQPDGSWRAPLHPHTYDGEMTWRQLQAA